MTHQEYEERLGGIMQSNHTKGSHADDSNDREPCLCEAKQAIDRLFLDAVGEDDAYGEFCSECSDWDDGRNDLRQQLRTTITGKEGGDDHTK